MHTLILNNDASPLSVIPLSTVEWQDAITYMYLDRVTVLEWYDDWIVRSESWETRVPAVIMLKKFVKRNLRPRFSKYNVLLRDHFECQYCGTGLSRDSATMDHVIPTSRGGKTHWKNIVSSCGACNTRKGNRLIDPRNTPRIPTYYELAAVRKSMGIEVSHPSWQDYIS